MTTYKLRNYQTDLINKIHSSWDAGHRRIMLQLATGGGKTIIFAHLARQFANEDKGVLVLAHREELLTQARDKTNDVVGLPSGMIKSGYPLDLDAYVQIASVQSLIRKDAVPPVELVIVDEAHHASSRTYTELMAKYPNARILGCTATPYRIDGQGFKWLFDRLICGPSTRELIEQGYLSPYRLVPATKTINTAKVKKTGGDFNLGQLAQSVSDQIEPIDVVAEWKEEAQGKKTVVFAVDIARSIQYKDAFVEAGIKAEHLDGETPGDRRKEILRQFADGEITILTNCGIISEGFDVPTIEAVQIVRPTESLSMWLQIVGRALRTSKGKEFATIIDHTDNWERLGLPDEDREWSLDPIPLTETAQRFLHIRCDSEYEANGKIKKCKHVFKPLPHELKLAKDSGEEMLIETKDGDIKVFRIGTSICPSCLTLGEFWIGDGKNSEAKDRNLAANSKKIEIDLKVYQKEFIDKFIAIANEAEKDNILTHPNSKKFSLGDWRYLAKKIGQGTNWALNHWKKAQKLPIMLETKPENVNPEPKRELSVEPSASNKPRSWHREIIDSLVEQQQQFGRKPGWVYFRFKDLPTTNPKFDIKAVSLEDWQYLASKLGYKSRWAYHQWEESQN